MSKRRIGFLALTVIILVVASVLVASATAGGKPLTTTLTGAAEAPGPGDPDATGTAVLDINPGQAEVCYTLTWQNIDGTVFAAHIHEAPAGQPGPVVVPLFVNQSFAGTGSASACVPADREELVEILIEPEEYYVNIHSTIFLAGAIRGQLGR